MQCYLPHGRSNRLSHRSFRTGRAIPHDRPTTALILETDRAAFPPRPSRPMLFLVLIVLTAHDFHASASPCVRRIVDSRVWRGFPDHPPRHLRARATSRRRERAANPPRAPTRSTLSAGVRPCGRRRERGGATVGVYVRFSQVWSAAAIIAGVMPSSSAAAAAAVGPLAAARSGASRCESVLCLPSAGRSWA